MRFLVTRVLDVNAVANQIIQARRWDQSPPTYPNDLQPVCSNKSINRCPP